MEKRIRIQNGEYIDVIATDNDHPDALSSVLHTLQITDCVRIMQADMLRKQDYKIADEWLRTSGYTRRFQTCDDSGNAAPAHYLYTKNSV